VLRPFAQTHIGAAYHTMRHPSNPSLSGPLVLLLLASLTLVSAQTNCQGKPNYQPIFTSDPVFVSSSTNGKLYMMKDVDPPLWVIHVYGSPYDMGFAQGTLLKTQIANLTVGFYDYVYAEVSHRYQGSLDSTEIPTDHVHLTYLRWMISYITSDCECECRWSHISSGSLRSFVK